MKKLTLLITALLTFNVEPRILEWLSVIAFIIAVPFFLSAVSYSRDSKDETCKKATKLYAVAGICLVGIGVCLLLLR